MVIKYKFADGHIEEIEVTEEFAVAYAAADKQFCRNEEKFAWRQRERETSYEKLHEQAGFDVADGSIGVEEYVISDDFCVRFMSLLTKQQKKIFQKHCIEDKSLRKIADEMNLSLHTVQEHIASIKKKYLKFFLKIPCQKRLSHSSIVKGVRKSQ